MSESKGAPTPYPTPRQSQLLWTALTALAVLALVGVAALIFLGFITFLSWAYPVLLPLGVAVIIALVLEPAVNFAHQRGLPRRTGTLGVCLLAVVGFMLFWAFLLPPLFSETGSFFYRLPGWIDEGFDKLETLEAVPAKPATETASPAAGLAATAPSTSTNQSAPAPGTTNGAPAVVAPAAPAAPPAPAPPARGKHGRLSAAYLRPILNHSQLQDWLKANVPVVQASVEKTLANLVYSAVGPVGQALGFILGFGFVPIYVYYFLADQDRIARHWHDYVPLRQSPLRGEVVAVLTEINQVLVKYFRGQIIVAGVNGLLTFVGLTAIGIPYSLVLGVMAGALSIVPFLGIIASILPALLLGFLSSQDWIRPVGVLIVFALVQFIESMFVTPRVQSHTTGLHPLTIIIGILFWSMLLPGLLGPVVAVPLTCAVVVLMRRYVWQGRTARGAAAGAKKHAPAT
jgi:predicted PurR-regulated permease PerM